MGFFDFFKTNKRQDNEILSESTDQNVIQFTLKNPVVEEVSKCKINDKVRVWKNPELDEMKVYRSGINPEVGRPFVYGEGLIGYVPDNYMEPIINHLEKKGEYISQIIDRNRCLIQVQIIPLEETLNKEENRREKLRQSLKKPYKPIKTSFKLRLNKDSEITIPKKTKLVINFKTLDEYINNVDDLELEFSSIDEKYNFSYYGRECMNMIRGNFSGYSYDVEIKKIETIYIHCFVSMEKKE